ncbi:signal peptidase I [Pseudomonas sp. LRF_L74]|uniref:signal peptidase I n=1 Tax=Pseudomonas sp. LRF_L74 TaxID=3369422 RepID=UPI003F620391
MRFSFWNAFSLLLVLIVGTYIANPFGVDSYDPRLRVFGLIPYAVPSASMAPTARPGDYVLVSPWPYLSHKPARGDIVVFRYPKDPGILYLKRLIGLPGERVAMHGGKVFIDGKALDEPYVNPDAQGARPETLEMEERLIGEGQLFMLGDNRHYSNDSRYWGTVAEDAVLGRVIKVF